MRRLSDQLLAARALAGEREAAGQLFRRHQAAAWRAAYRVCADPGLADEALQEGFIRAMRYLHAYDPQRPFGTWISVVVANRARTLRRRAVGRGEEPLSDDMQSPVDETEAVDGQIVFDGAMQTLPDEQRRVVLLRVVLGLSTAETAEATGVSEGTVKSRMARARQRLRVGLEGHDRRR